MAQNSQYKLALEIIANARQALAEVAKIEKSVTDINKEAAKSGGLMSRGLRRGLGVMHSIRSAAIGMGSIFKRASGALITGFRTAFSLVRNISRVLFRLPIRALKLGALGVGAVAGGAFLAHKALAPAAKVERYQEQLRVQGTPDMLPWLKEQAMKTTNSLDEIIQSAIMAQNFNIDPKKFLGPMMDVSAMFNKPLQEITQSLGMIKAGRFGEGLESLSRSGITRQDLKVLGIKFDNGGAVAKSSQDKVFGAIIQLMKTRFGGAAQRRAGTYEGQISMLGDSVFNALSEGLAPFLPYATKIVQEVKGIIGSVGDALKTIDWKSWGESALSTMKEIRVIASKMLTGEGRTSLAADIKNAWLDIQTKIIPAIGADIRNNLGSLLGWVGGEAIKISTLMVQTIAAWLGSSEAIDLVAKLGQAFRDGPGEVVARAGIQNDIINVDLNIKELKKEMSRVQRGEYTQFEQTFDFAKKSPEYYKNEIFKQENRLSGLLAVFDEMEQGTRFTPGKYTPSALPSLNFTTPGAISETLGRAYSSAVTPLPERLVEPKTDYSVISGVLGSLISSFKTPGRINEEYFLGQSQQQSNVATLQAAKQKITEEFKKGFDDSIVGKQLIRMIDALLSKTQNVNTGLSLDTQVSF